MLREISAEIETKDSPVWVGGSYLQGCETDREYQLHGVTAGRASSSYIIEIILWLCIPITVETKAVSVGLKTPKLVVIEEVCQTVCPFQTSYNTRVAVAIIDKHI